MFFFLAAYTLPFFLRSSKCDWLCSHILSWRDLPVLGFILELSDVSWTLSSYELGALTRDLIIKVVSIDTAYEYIIPLIERSMALVLLRLGETLLESCPLPGEYPNCSFRLLCIALYAQECYLSRCWCFISLHVNAPICNGIDTGSGLLNYKQDYCMFVRRCLIFAGEWVVPREHLRICALINFREYL